MKTIATTHLTSNSGSNYRYTLAVYSNCKGRVRFVEVLENESYKVGPRPYQILDLLARIMPEKLYTKGVKVELGVNPVRNPSLTCIGHPCLIVLQDKIEKRYRLDQVVSDGWVVGIPSAHLRAMVKWWRAHREEFDMPPLEWGFWHSEC